MVSGSLPDMEEGKPTSARPPLCTYTQTFNEAIPYYLSIGMTPEQFWDGYPALAAQYRRADRMKKDRRNQELWLQGLYIYDALCNASPLFHDLAKEGTTANPYPEKPYPLTAKQRKQDMAERERKEAEKGRRMMEAFMAETNRRFGRNTITKNTNEGGEPCG